MKSLEMCELADMDFKVFGYFEKMIKPKTEKISAAENVDFYRDMISLQLGAGNAASFSICKVSRGEPVVGLIEYHNHTEEAILPLDGDIAIAIGPATPPGVIPADSLKVVHIPRGIMVVLNMGVWHSGPFVLKTDPVHILVALPERTYANDCVVETLKPDDGITIVGI